MHKDPHVLDNLTMSWCYKGQSWVNKSILSFSTGSLWTWVSLSAPQVLWSQERLCGLFYLQLPGSSSVSIHDAGGYCQLEPWHCLWWWVRCKQFCIPPPLPCSVIFIHSFILGPWIHGPVGKPTFSIFSELFPSLPSPPPMGREQPFTWADFLVGTSCR